MKSKSLTERMQDDTNSMWANWDSWLEEIDEKDERIEELELEVKNLKLDLEDAELTHSKPEGEKN